MHQVYQKTYLPIFPHLHNFEKMHTKEKLCMPEGNIKLNFLSLELKIYKCRKVEDEKSCTL